MTARADTKDDVPALIKQLQDKDEIVRLKAAKALGKLGADAKDAVPALTDAVKDTDEDVRSVAKQALAKIKEAMADSDKDAALTRLLALLKDAKSDDKEVKAKAILGLGKLLGSDDDIIRVKAVRGLAESGGAARTVSKELEQAAKDPDEGVRREARKALDNIKEALVDERKAQIQEKITPLLKNLKDKSAATRQKALDAIADIGPDAADASEPILAMLTDKVPGIQQAAMDTLEKINPALHKPVFDCNG
jgi:HEAT repeat protein